MYRYMRWLEIGAGKTQGEKTDKDDKRKTDRFALTTREVEKTHSLS